MSSFQTILLHSVEAKRKNENNWLLIPANALPINQNPILLLDFQEWYLIV